MESWHHIQRSFSGGEISRRMLMRQDHEYYKQSALGMTNFIPTPQGSVVRAPGTQYLEEITSLDARCIPYLTSGNERSLLVFTPGSVRLIRSVTHRITTDVGGIPPDPGVGSVIYRAQIMRNSSFKTGLDYWRYWPVEYLSRNGDGPLGVYWVPGARAMKMQPRLYKYGDATRCVARTTCAIETPTDVVTLAYDIRYTHNNPIDGGFRFKIHIATDKSFTNEIFTRTYSHTQHPSPGVIFNPGPVNATLPTAGWTGTLYIRLEATAVASSTARWSTPTFLVRHVKIYANAEAQLTDATLSTPYTAEDLPDLHYVQSPYANKDLVITHPKHPPHHFFFNAAGGSYMFTPITFTNQPSEWAVNNYPAACTAFNGRLVLAGGQSFLTATGDPVATVSETVWCTKVGEWGTFSAEGEVDPDESVTFTSIHRSPIQWVFGQNRLLVGALEYEYSAYADSIFAPGDIGIFLQSTHGSNQVQPAGFGNLVIYPADAGTKARAMSFEQNTESWVSADLTIYNPEICYPEIRRLARLRNPHQMCLVLKTSGDLAIFHSESGLEGWSRYVVNGGHIIDMCVLAGEDGRDIPFLLVKRFIGDEDNGEDRLYLEAIPNFSFDSDWVYTNSHVTFNFETPRSTLTGLAHLESMPVHVSDTDRYIGTFEVTNGTVNVTDALGNPVLMTSCIVGLQHRSTLITLPPEKLDPGAEAGYSSFAVRVSGSTRPVINGERPADREPLSPMGVSQELDALRDVHVNVPGWNPYLPIEITEQLPLRCEILGVYGKIQSDSP